MLLGLVRARRVLAQDVSTDDRMLGRRSVVHVRGRVLLALVLRGRHERILCGRTVVCDRDGQVRAGVGLLLEHVQQRDVREGAGLSARGRDVQRRCGVLRASVHERSLRAPRGMPRRGRGLRDGRRLLLGHVQRVEPVRERASVQRERRQARQQARRRSVRGTAGLFDALVRRDERRRKALRADRRLHRAVRALRHGRRLLLRIVRGGREQRETLRSKSEFGELRRRRRALHGHRAVLQHVHVHGGQRVAAMRARDDVREQRSVRGRLRVLQRALRPLAANARVRGVRRGRRALHRELGLLLFSNVRVRTHLGRADLCTANPLMEVV